MKKVIDAIKKKLNDTAGMLEEFYKEKKARVQRIEYAKKELEKSTPVEQVSIDYSSTDLGIKIANYRKTLSGHLTLENIEFVGGLVHEALIRDIPNLDHIFDKSAELKAILSEYYELENELKKVNQSQFDTYKDFCAFKEKKIKEKNEKVIAYDGLSKEIDAARADLSIKTIKLLHSIRKPTNLESKELKQLLIANPKCAHVNPLIEALRDYPKEMVEGFVKNIGMVTIDAKAKRGRWIKSTRTIAIRDRKQTAYHELGHVMEAACPSILFLEAEYYNKRTVGCKLEKLKDIVENSAYKSDEVTRKDSFVSPYLGKDYAGTAYELVSMGFEMYFSKPDELLKDEDFFKFIAGILVTVAP